MNSFDIIPDIHGQAGKLTKLLKILGWEKSNNSWRNTDPGRQIVFLGDFIDRGPDNKEVLRIVRELVEAGRAQAIMGNHELNAIHYHSIDPETGEPVRKHSDKNKRQHQGFLKEFPLGSPEAQNALDWFMTLPLWLDLGPFRVVHACWAEAAVQSIRKHAPNGVLSKERLIAAGRKDDPLYGHIEILTKGPEIDLPEGYGFKDKDGHKRTSVRLTWWRRYANSWQEAAISVPDVRDLPSAPLPEEVQAMLYDESAPPVFFGHYWMVGEPVLEASNAICLDYSAGMGGPLIAYRFTEPHSALSLSNLVVS